ncbi:alpha/beta hydrolase [Pseudomonas baltica]|uniref:Alpha/beta hydrolase n=1 Tax=Pseudomonas baltica TaxID=2762576 RepID=A0A7X1KUD7_9PSED|nr:alpha/beta hydrolase [Pseudomonas baltica]MBC2679709.1 alpha/beta hydrolase [Pseudomonas baltica]
MNRRNFILGASSAMLMLKLAAAQANDPPANSETVELWSGVPPGGGGPSGDNSLTSHGSLSNVTRPYLQIFKPATPNGKAVIVAAGGGYKRIELGIEGWPLAQWLTERGYTAYVLAYRLPSEGWNAGNIVALQDAQRALRIVRSREKHVTLLGFSAGGHLMGMTATLGDSQTYAAQDSIDSIPAVAEGAALIYPPITLERPYTYTSTHKVLVGPDASAAEEAKWSVQNRVTGSTPPEFLVQAEDDSVVDPHNTLIMAAACEQRGVAVEMHRYATGGHGFGLGRRGTASGEWPGRYEAWLGRLGVG